MYCLFTRFSLTLGVLAILLFSATNCKFNIDEIDSEIKKELQGKWVAEKIKIVPLKQEMEIEKDSFYLRFECRTDQLGTPYPKVWNNYSKGIITVDEKLLVFRGVYTDSLFMDSLTIPDHPKKNTGSYYDSHSFYIDNDTLILSDWVFIKIQ